jgi:hypothetical protein
VKDYLNTHGKPPSPIFKMVPVLVFATLKVSTKKPLIFSATLELFAVNLIL